MARASLPAVITSLCLLVTSCATDVPTVPQARTSMTSHDSRHVEPEVASSAGVDPTPVAPGSRCAGQLSAHEEDGKIVLCRSDSTALRLTQTGRDSEPALSPDGTQVAFVRLAGKERIALSGGDSVEIRDARIITIEAKGAGEREVARNGECTSLGHPLWLDERHIAVHAHGYDVPTAHNKSVCFIDTATGKMKEIAESSLCVMPLRAGRFRGAAFVGGADFVAGGGTEGWFAVVSSSGKKLTTLEENPFVRDYNGDGDIRNEERDAGCDEPEPAWRTQIDAVAGAL